MIETMSVKKISEFEDKSLLIVDDDNPFRERLSRAMEKKGFEVTQAESVKRGIESLKVKKPAFAVIDLRLNDGNGLEVVKELQDHKNLIVMKIWFCSLKITQVKEIHYGV